MHNKEEKGLGIKDNNAKSTKAKCSVDDQDNPQTQENRSNKSKSRWQSSKRVTSIRGSCQKRYKKLKC